MSTTIATINIWGTFGSWPSRLPLLAAAVAALGPTVLLVQECENAEQLSQLASTLGFPHAVAAAPDRESVAILSSRRILTSAVAVMHCPDGPRFILCADVDRLGWIACTHLSLDRSSRMAQLQRVLSCPTDGPAIVGGDLNATVAEVLPLARRLGWSVACDPSETTWPVDAAWFARGWTERLGNEPDFDVTPRRIDWVLGRQVHVLAHGVADPGSDAAGRPGSDHRIVWATFEADAHRSAR